MAKRTPEARRHPIFKSERPPKEPAKNYYQAQKYAGLSYNYAQISDEHRQTVQEAALEIRRWQRDTIAIGKTLLAIKELLPFGQFQEWWQTEFSLGERMVQSLLTVARVYGDPSNPRRVAGLSDGALYLLAAPSTPEVARAEVEQLLIEGHTPTRAEVKQVLGKYVGNPLRAKQLPAPPESSPEGGQEVIEAEYTVIQSDSDLLELALPRGIVRKLYMAALRGPRLKEAMTSDELDRLFIVCQRALEGKS